LQPEKGKALLPYETPSTLEVQIGSNFTFTIPKAVPPTTLVPVVDKILNTV